jgi:hypothetical protein
MEEETPNTSLPKTSESTTLVLADPPVIKRLRAVLAELTTFVSRNGGGKQKRVNFVIKHIVEDVVEELEGLPQEHMSAYFAQMGQVISWIGTGDDNALPPAIKEYLQARAGTLPELALEDETSENLEGASVGSDS